MIAVQLPLPGFGDTPLPKQRRNRKHRKSMNDSSELMDDRLVTTYLHRLHARGVAPKGFAAYRYQLRTLLTLAEHRVGRPVTVGAIFRDPALLGYALTHDCSITDGRQLSKWTLAQRRSAIRSFAALMAPELTRILAEDPHTVLDRALRGVAQRVGTGYRLTGGGARRRGGYTPKAEEIAAVITAAGQAPDFRGIRNAAFFGILAESGARVNALRELDGADCVVMPSGQFRLFLHAKGKDEAREVALSRLQVDVLRAYTGAFNRHALANGWRVRIRIGEPGPIWRNGPRGCWSYQDVVKTLLVAATNAHVPTCTPHALRRAFASDAARTLPRHIVALAGGWQGLERLDDHYIQVHDTQIWTKVGKILPVVRPDVEESEDVDAATATVHRYVPTGTSARAP